MISSWPVGKKRADQPSPTVAGLNVSSSVFSLFSLPPHLPLRCTSDIFHNARKKREPRQRRREEGEQVTGQPRKFTMCVFPDFRERNRPSVSAADPRDCHRSGRGHVCADTGARTSSRTRAATRTGTRAVARAVARAATGAAARTSTWPCTGTSRGAVGRALSYSVPVDLRKSLPILLGGPSDILQRLQVDSSGLALRLLMSTQDLPGHSGDRRYRHGCLRLVRGSPQRAK